MRKKKERESQRGFIIHCDFAPRKTKFGITRAMSKEQEIGRIMAIDLGGKRIGIALSDPTRLFAKSHTVLSRQSLAEDVIHYQQLITQMGVTLVLLGLPTYLDGTESEQTKRVREYGEQLRPKLGIPLHYCDETLSSKEAERTMVAQGTTRKKRRTQLDAVAAATFLQRYLDAQAYQNPVFMTVEPPYG